MGSARGSVVATWTITIVAIAFCMSLVADPRLRVEPHGRYATGPASWWVNVRLEPDADDRWLDVIADGTIYSRSGFPLAGAQSFRIKQVLFKDLVEGCYDVIAEVRRRDQDGPIVARAVAPWRLTVLGPQVDAMTCE